MGRKTTVCRFQATNWRVCTRNDMDRTKKRKAQERNRISFNSSSKQHKLNKVKIDNTRQNRKCRLCGDRDEAVNYMINECSKLAQKEYKIRHDWVGKVIHWELCKRLIWPYYQYQYMHKLQFVQENEYIKFFGILRYKWRIT